MSRSKNKVPSIDDTEISITDYKYNSTSYEVNGRKKNIPLHYRIKISNRGNGKAFVIMLEKDFLSSKINNLSEDKRLLRIMKFIQNITNIYLEVNQK